MSSQRNCEAYSRTNIYAFLPLALLSPHLSFAGDEEPDLLDTAMGHGFRGLARSEFEMSHASSREAKENAHVATIRRHSVGTCR